MLDEIKKAREEARQAVQRGSAAPTVLVTEDGEGPSYRMRGALQPRGEEDAEVWVQKESDAVPPARGGYGGRIHTRPEGNGGDPDLCVMGALCRRTDPKNATAPKTQSRSKDQNKDKDNSK